MMRRLLIFLVLFSLVSVGCKQKEAEKQNIQKADGSAPEISFNKLYFDYGTITEGEKVAYTFSFKNTGGSELIIQDAIASCGCTVPKYEKKPVKPGEEGKVEVVFDSKGFRGHQYKSILLKTNTPYGKKTLTIKANVISK